MAAAGGADPRPSHCSIRGISISGLRDSDPSAGVALFTSYCEEIHFSDIVFVGCEEMDMNMVKLAEASRRCSVSNIRGSVRAQSGFDGVLGINGGIDCVIQNFDVADLQENAGSANLLFARQHPITNDASSGAVFRDGIIRGVKFSSIGSVGTASQPDTTRDVLFDSVVILSRRGLTLHGQIDNLRLLNCTIEITASRALNIDFGDTARFDITNLRVHNCVFSADGTAEAVRIARVEDIAFTHNVVNGPNAEGAALAILEAAPNGGVVHFNSVTGGTMLPSGNLDNQFNAVVP